MFQSNARAAHSAESLTCRHRRGLTLVEMMITLVITLIIVYGVVRIIQAVGKEVRFGRAAIEMSGQIRMVAHRLRTDLSQVTLPVRPWLKSSSGLGYFEYLEGGNTDKQLLTGATPDPDDSARGDADDVLMFTARSRGEPFVGRWFNGTTTVTVESHLAEIIWWTDLHRDVDGDGVWDPGDEYVLHRRVLLIRPDLNDSAGLLIAATNLPTFYNSNDISIHPIRDSGGVITGVSANSLADLTRREYRFAHDDTTFPHEINLVQLRSHYDSTAATPAGLIQADTQEGLDVIAGHLLGFDVKAYDPSAPIRVDTDNHSLLPGDIGWSASSTQIGQGAYVDLAYDTTLDTSFSDLPENKSKLTTNTYCTWSWHYETDGINQDSLLGADQGTNGLDDNDANGVDDVAERETAPPYPVPLRGIQIRIRLLEQDSQQLREMSVTSNFVPE